ncbi:hypothetical protein NQZ68_019302, partial [Dissostichus eleginoides]
ILILRLQMHDPLISATLNNNSNNELAEPTPPSHQAGQKIFFCSVSPGKLGRGQWCVNVSALRVV